MTDALPYTGELLDKLDLFLAAAVAEAPESREHILQLLDRAGIALVDRARRQALIDERVYSGVLFRLRQAEERIAEVEAEIARTAGLARDLTPAAAPDCAPPAGDGASPSPGTD